MDPASPHPRIPTSHCLHIHHGHLLAFPAQDDAAFQWLLARSGAAVVAGRADPTLLSVGLVLPPGDTAQVTTAGIGPP